MNVALNTLYMTILHDIIRGRWLNSAQNLYATSLVEPCLIKNFLAATGIYFLKISFPFCDAETVSVRPKIQANLKQHTVPSRSQGTTRTRPQYSVPFSTVDIPSTSLFDDWSITAVHIAVLAWLIDKLFLNITAFLVIFFSWSGGKKCSREKFIPRIKSIDSLKDSRNRGCLSDTMVRKKTSQNLFLV